MRKALLSAGVLLAASVGSHAGWSDLLRGLSERLERLAEEPRRRANVPAAVAAVRGWSPEEAAADSRRRDYDSLKRLEGIEISDGELERFLREGGLAP